jgi:hypothetical protein
MYHRLRSFSYVPEGEFVSHMGRLTLIALAIFLYSSLIAQTEPHVTGPKKTEVDVPFVGCNSDGQTGPVEAPIGKSKSVSITLEAASQLAYYRSEQIGVLAPRGWYCFGTYGSNGVGLYVTPQPINGADLFSDAWKGFSGPAIEIAYESGDTSGRFTVARMIARVFPAHRAFAERVVAEDIEPETSFQIGPCRTDKLTYRSKEIVEFQTPGNKDGLGTDFSGFRKNSDPISGVAVLTGEAPDLLFLAVRLPSNLSSLSPAIIQQAKRAAEN